MRAYRTDLYTRTLIDIVSRVLVTLLLASSITVMFYVDYLYFTDSFVFYCVYVTVGLTVLIDVLIYSAAQLQECLINLLTYLLTCLLTLSQSWICHCQVQQLHACNHNVVVRTLS